MSTELKIEKTKPRSKIKRTRKVIMRILWALVLLTILSLIALNYAINQQWGTHKIESILSKNLNTTVSIDTFHFNIFNGIKLDKLYIEDHKQDTLLYSSTAQIILKGNPINLLFKHVLIDEIILIDPLFNIVTYKGDSLTNFTRLLNSPKENDGNNNDDDGDVKSNDAVKIDLELKKVHLTNGTLRRSDKNHNKYESYNVKTLDALIDSINIEQKRFILHSIDITNPFVTIDKMPYQIDVDSYNEEESNGDYEDEDEDDEEDEDEDDENKKPSFTFISKSVNINNGYFEFNNNRSSSSRHLDKEAIDFDHMMVYEIDVEMVDFKMQDLNFEAQFTHSSLREESGFKINSFCFGEGKLSNSSLILNDLQLYTPYSNIGDTFKITYDGYPSYLKYVDEVYMKTKLKQSKVNIHDVMYFAKALRSHHFFVENEFDEINLDGRIFGLINNLKTRNVRLRMGSKILFEGNIDIRNATTRGQELLNIKAKKLQGHITTFANLFTNKGISPNLSKLGNIAFKGRFDGFFQDFVSYGDIESNLGQLHIDMKLNTRKGLLNADYSGALELKEFDLGTYISNPKLGIVNLISSVKQGHGLSFETAQANLNAKIYNVTYNKYTYKDVLFDGILNKELIDGKLEVHDPNIDLDFDGVIKNINTIPSFDFKANIESLKPDVLNFMKNELTIKGILNVAFEGLDPDIIEGSVIMKDVELSNGTDKFYLNNANISQHALNKQLRTLSVDSDVLDLNISGNYQLTKLHKDFIRAISKTHPSIGKALHFPTYDIDTIHRFYTLTADIKKTQNMIAILSGKNINLNDVTMTGYYYGGLDSLGLSVKTPSFSYEDIEFNDVFIDIYNGPKNVSLNIQGADINRKTKKLFNNFNLLSYSNSDTIFSKIFLDNNAYLFENFDLNIQYYPIPKIEGFGIKFLPSDIIENNRKWVFNPANQIFYGKDHLDIRELSLRTADRQISIENIKDKGIELFLNNFHLNFIDSMLHISQLDFEGNCDIKLNIKDVFKFEGIEGQLTSSNFDVGKIGLGNLIIDYQMKDLKSPLKIWLNTTKGNQTLKTNGEITIGALQDPPIKETKYNFNINANRYPLEALELIIPNGISNTSGVVSGSLKLNGINSKPKLIGEVILNEGQTTIDYLGTTYYFDDQIVQFKENIWDFTGAILKDSLENEAIITGGIKHNYLKDYVMDATIKSDKIIGLNTTKILNPDYYGYAIGNVEVTFDGPFRAININVKATTAKNTYLSIPVGEVSNAQNKSNFIYFSKVDSIAERDKPAQQSGLNFAMDLVITEDATTSIIFDEQAGDILQGNGNGSIRLTVDPSGKITMYGVYNVVKGRYLFTLINLVNKPFIVRPGGTIKWNGDPLDAQLNIEAVYDGLSAQLYPLIEQYVQNESDKTQNEAKNFEKIELQMKITEQLFHPKIDFDIFFPNLTGKLRSYVSAEMSSIRLNQAKLNQQVFGLIVLGRFFPSTGFNNQGLASSIGISTVSELLAHNLSVLVTGWLQSAVRNVDLISGVDFYLDYNQINTILDAQQETNILNGELNFQVKTRFINDKIEITYGGAFSNGSLVYNSYYNNTVNVELLQTGIKGLRFRMFYKDEQIPYINLPRRKFGFGTSFRKEFDDFKRKK